MMSDHMKEETSAYWMRIAWTVQKPLACTFGEKKPNDIMSATDESRSDIAKHITSFLLKLRN